MPSITITLKYLIGKSDAVGEFRHVYDKEEVSQEDFEKKLTKKIEEIAANKPEKIPELKIMMKGALRKGVSIIDTFFQIEVIKKKEVANA